MIAQDLITPGMERCVESCTQCHHVCLRAVMGESLHARTEAFAPEHVRLMLDCANLCALTADFLLRGSAFHERVCAVCAQICQACAQSCTQFAALEDCVRACNRCAEDCRIAAGVTR